MLTHKIIGFGLFRIDKGKPIFNEYFTEKEKANKEKKIYDKAYQDDLTRVYPTTILVDVR